MSVLAEAQHPLADEEMSGEVVLRVRGLYKLSLRGVNLTIRKGERVAIIGRTGEGKSVLLRCVIGLMSGQGEIETLGRPVRGEVVVHGDLGVAFQSPGLLDAWSIGENLHLASGRVLAEDEVRSWMNAVGLGSVSLEGSVSSLSGGQQKRLALVMALLRGRMLIVLDEPTSGLDPDTAEQVAEALELRVRDEGRTLLLVTHDYETAVRICNRFLLLTPTGTLRELVIDAHHPPADTIALLRHALANVDAERKPLPSTPPERPTTLDRTAALLIQALPLAAMAMSLLGAMFVQQSGGLAFIDISRHIPAVLVSAVFRETAPLVVGLLLASRIGARLAAEVAGMSYTSQLASMRLLGLSPSRLLLLPYWISASIVFPICILAGGFAAILAGAGVSSWSLSIGSARFLSLGADAFTPVLVATCIVKGVLMAVCVSVVSYSFGVAPMSSAQSVGTAVTKAVVVGSMAIVVVDVIVSWVAFGG